MNRKEYKASMSGIRPSEQTIERIMDMTYDKKTSRVKTFKRIISAALAFAILLCGGIGLNHMVNSSKPLCVMVAYADEFMRVESGTKQKILNGLYFAPVDDVQKNKEQLAKAQKDYNDVVDEVSRLGKDEEASWSGVGKYDIYDAHGKVVAKLYTSGAGYFVVNKKNYKDVKLFTVENQSKDGYLQFEWSGTYDMLVNETEKTVDDENPYAAFINHKFTLTGDELRKSQGDFNEYGYRLEWVPTASVFEIYDPDPVLNAGDIQDKIIFTFEYNDGTKESISVNIEFDDYGHMQIS